MVKVTVGNTHAIACDKTHSYKQLSHAWDVRLWQYNALWKHYIVVVVVKSHSCKRCMVTRCSSWLWWAGALLSGKCCCFVRKPSWQASEEHPSALCKFINISLPAYINAL